LRSPAAGVGSPVLRRTGRISDETSLGGPSPGTYYCARVVSVMIAQWWETRVQRGTQPVRLKTGCTNFRLGMQPSSRAFPTIIPPRNRQRFNPPANHHLCGTLLGGKLCNGKPPRKIPNPSSFFDNGQGGQPMALGLKALGPLGLWESLAGSVLFPGHDRYYFSTQSCSMQFHRHQSRHAR
jgi:hypothetical protein